MRKTRTSNLKVLALEDRLTPAVSLNLISGSLYISGDATSNSVFISGKGNTAAGIKVHVVAGDVFDSFTGDPSPYETAGNLKGSFNVTGGIYVTMQNQRDFVCMTLDDGGTIAGDVSMTMNGGNDEVMIQNRTNTGATLGSRLLINCGDGADNVFVFDTTISKNTNVDGGKSGTRPNGIINANVPGDVFMLFNCKTGDVGAANCITVLDDALVGGSNLVQGNLTVNNTTANQQGGFFVNGQAYGKAPGDGYSGLLVVGAASKVTGNVVYSGSDETDGIYIDGRVDGNVNLNGNSSATNAVNGKNDFVLSGTVGGTYNIQGAAGVDFVQLNDAAVVSKSALLNMGGGSNQYDLDHTFVVASGIPVATYATNPQIFTVVGGTGNDPVGIVGGTIGTPGVPGSIRFQMGDGSNSVTWEGLYLGTNNGDLTYAGGTGVDVLSVNGQNVNAATAFRLIATMGDGNDTVNIYPTTVVSNAGGGSSNNINFGTGATDTFNRNGDGRDPFTFWNVSNQDIINP